MLQLYHIFYNYTLRNIESEKLYPVLVELTSTMLKKSRNIHNKISDEKLKKASLKNIAYFSVASQVLNIKVNLPQSVKKIVNKELNLINQHQGRMESAIFPFCIDYSQFIPRGHYTRTEKFKKFFKAMM